MVQAFVFNYTAAVVDCFAAEFAGLAVIFDVANNVEGGEFRVLLEGLACDWQIGMLRYRKRGCAGWCEP